jgi:hypothetical protein
MRGSIPGGRFTVESEIDRYWAGMDEDLQRPVGGEVPWWRYDPQATEVDPIYNVGSEATGRVFRDPIPVKYIVAQVFQGQTFQNDRGFYNADVLRLTMAVPDLLRVFPDIISEVDNYLKDRVMFQDKPFRPSRMYLRGKVLDRYAVVTIDLIEVKEEELVNDDQFPPYGVVRSISETLTISDSATGV